MMSETYFLMFGVETQKNPAALVYNMMIIDMFDGDTIGGDNISHNEAFNSTKPIHSPENGNGGCAPYSIDDATTASRYLNLYYSHLFNHWYTYDMHEGTDRSILENLMDPRAGYNKSRGARIRFEEMMHRECDMVSMWIRLRQDRDRNSRHLRTLQHLYDYIVVKTADFYTDIFSVPFQPPKPPRPKNAIIRPA
jgi:hypothetical protein